MIFFYILEIQYRLFYLILCLILCLILSLHNIFLLILFKTSFFLSYFSKEFILTQLTDFFEIIWFIIPDFLFSFLFSLFLYHLYDFFIPSYYYFQKKLVKKLFLLLFLSINLIYYHYHLITLPILFDFFINWNILNPKLNNLLLVTLKIHLFSYLKWVSVFHFILTNCFSFFILIIYKFWLLVPINVIYSLLKLQKKKIIYFIIFCFYLVTSFDVYLLFFLTLIILFTYEIFFFFVCFNLTNF